MALINNAGGSLTSAVLLTLLAWGVRWLRAELNRKRQVEEGARVASRRSLGRFSARLSPAALRMLVGGLCKLRGPREGQLVAGLLSTHGHTSPLGAGSPLHTLPGPRAGGDGPLPAPRHQPAQLRRPRRAAGGAAGRAAPARCVHGAA